MLNREYKVGLAVVALGVLVVGCGGGGGATLPAPSNSSQVNVVSALGQFDPGVPVVIMNASGTTIGSGEVGADGRANVTLTVAHDGVMVIEVGCKTKSPGHCNINNGALYWDEGKNNGLGGKNVIPVGKTLNAVAPKRMDTVVVTPVSHIARALINPATSTANEITAITNAVARMLGLPNGFDPLSTPPTLASQDKPTVTGGSADGARYALLLAALANFNTNGADAFAKAETLASELEDGTFESFKVADLIKAMETLATSFISDPALKITITNALDEINPATIPNNINDASSPQSTNQAGINVARAFVADLRTRILPYYNPLAAQPAGILNANVVGLESELKSLPINGMLVNVLMLMDVDDLLSKPARQYSIGTGYRCDKQTPSTASCVVRDYANRTVQTMTFTYSNGTLSWADSSMSKVGTLYSVNGVMPSISRFSAGYAGSQTGFDTMTVQSVRTGDLWKTTITAKAIVDQDSNDAALLEIRDVSGTIDSPAVSVTDLSPYGAEFEGTVISANYRLTGTLGLTNLRSNNVDVLQVGTLTFDGVIRKVTQNYDFLDGMFTLTPANGSAKGVLGFTGNAKKDANDAGLQMSAVFELDPTKATDRSRIYANFGSDNIVYLDEMVPGEASDAYTLKRGNLTMTVSVSNGAMTGEILVDGERVARFSQLTVIYLDNTFESLIQ